MSLIASARPLVAWRWLGVPALLSLLATFALAIPIDLLGLRLPEPVFPLLLSFAWAVIRPSILAPFVLMGLGLILDLFWGGLAGVWGISMLVPYAMVLSVRSVMIGQSRAMAQVWYSVMVAVAFAVAYMLTALNDHAFPNLISVFWQFLATSLLYPFAHRLIERFEDADVRFR